MPTKREYSDRLQKLGIPFEIRPLVEECLTQVDETKFLFFARDRLIQETAPYIKERDLGTILKDALRKDNGKEFGKILSCMYSSCVYDMQAGAALKKVTTLRDNLASKKCHPHVVNFRDGLVSAIDDDIEDFDALQQSDAAINPEDVNQTTMREVCNMHTPLSEADIERIDAIFKKPDIETPEYITQLLVLVAITSRQNGAEFIMGLDKNFKASQQVSTYVHNLSSVMQEYLIHCTNRGVEYANDIRHGVAIGPDRPLGALAQDYYIAEIVLFMYAQGKVNDYPIFKSEPEQGTFFGITKESMADWISLYRTLCLQDGDSFHQQIIDSYESGKTERAVADLNRSPENFFPEVEPKPEDNSEELFNHEGRLISFCKGKRLPVMQDETRELYLYSTLGIFLTFYIVYKDGTVVPIRIAKDGQAFSPCAENISQDLYERLCAVTMNKLKERKIILPPQVKQEPVKLPPIKPITYSPRPKGKYQMPRRRSQLSSEDDGSKPVSKAELPREIFPPYTLNQEGLDETIKKGVGESKYHQVACRLAWCMANGLRGKPLTFHEYKRKLTSIRVGGGIRAVLDFTDEANPSLFEVGDRNSIYKKIDQRLKENL